VIRQVLEDLMPLADNKAIDLGIIGDEDANVAAGELDMKVLISNLVDNAIRYTPNGGRIDLSVRTDDKRTILQIDDTGPGIPQEERERVFDPFYRVTGSDEAGSGLGLSIVKTIASRIDASVTFADANDTINRGLRGVVIFNKL
jgi:two-component system OmpR family sensor kinase